MSLIIVIFFIIIYIVGFLNNYITFLKKSLSVNAITTVTLRLDLALRAGKRIATSNLIAEDERASTTHVERRKEHRIYRANARNVEINWHVDSC